MGNPITRISIRSRIGTGQRRLYQAFELELKGFSRDHASLFQGGTKFFLTEPRTQPRDGNSALVTIGPTGRLATMKKKQKNI